MTAYLRRGARGPSTYKPGKMREALLEHAQNSCGHHARNLERMNRGQRLRHEHRPFEDRTCFWGWMAEPPRTIM